MNEVDSNLWIGDLPSALNVQELKKNKISSILSLMRGRLAINQTFIRRQIEMDDTEHADIMSHFLPSIQFILAELDKGRGVLVHCQAGLSRSPAVVAAYLIYTRNINPDEALSFILSRRPFICPNANFVRQLELFHKAQGKISTSDKEIRRFYLERTVQEVMNGDGSHLGTNMLSSFPNSPSSSRMNTPNPARRRRIRCKMCRQELATREHMLDHGSSTPLSMSPAVNATTELSNSSRSVESTSEDIDLDPSRQQFSNLTVASASEVKEDTSQLYSGQKLTPPVSPPAMPMSPAPVGLHAVIVHSPPILVDPKCSGYFVEPMKWMEHFLSAGQLAGKITCPNNKCGAKLGNYDWAGMCCGCKGWVTPGFCINRSKVDEVG